MKMTLKLETQKIYAIAIAYMLSFTGILSLVNSLLNMLGVSTSLDTVLIYGILFVLVLFGILLSICDSQHILLDVWLVVIFFVVSYALSYFLYTENRKYMVTSFSDYSKNPVFLVFLYSLPCYIFVRKLSSYEYLQKVIVVFSYAIVAMSIVVFFFGGDVFGKQYMTFSYNMLLQLFALVYHKPKKCKVLHYVFLAVGLFVFVFGGARGALVAFVLAVVLYKVFATRLSIKGILQSIAIILVVGAFMLFQDYLISWLIDLLDAFSIESRTFEYVMQGDFWSDSNRARIYALSMEKISIFGCGMRGDRSFLNGSYVHNIFIEIWVHFGWIFGTLISALLLIVLFRGMLKKEKPEQFYIFMLLGNGFVALLVSGSYLNQCPAFFALFGFCVSAIAGSSWTIKAINFWKGRLKAWK